MTSHFDWNDISDGEIEMALDQLVEAGILEKKNPPFREPYYSTTEVLSMSRVRELSNCGEALCDLGYNFFEQTVTKLIDQQDSKDTEEHKAPASDRIVSLLDNRKEVEELREKIEKLKSAIEEHGHNNVDEKEAALGELEAVSIPLTRDAIFIDRWYQRLLRVCSSIGEKFVDASLQALASELPSLALEFLSLF